MERFDLSFISSAGGSRLVEAFTAARSSEQESDCVDIGGKHS